MPFKIGEKATVLSVILVTFSNAITDERVFAFLRQAAKGFLVALE